jgi:RHS repeat-associated protein
MTFEDRRKMPAAAPSTARRNARELLRRAPASCAAVLLGLTIAASACREEEPEPLASTSGISGCPLSGSGRPGVDVRIAECSTETPPATATSCNGEFSVQLTPTDLADRIEFVADICKLGVGPTVSDLSHFDLELSSLLGCSLPNTTMAQLITSCTPPPEGDCLIEDPDPTTQIRGLKLDNLEIGDGECDRAWFTVSKAYVGPSFTIGVGPALAAVKAGQEDIRDSNALVPGYTCALGPACASIVSAPHAADDAFSVPEDGTLSGNVLTNDSDPDQDPLTAVLVSDVQHGTLVLSPNGAFTYSPVPDFFGSDAFTYQASDGAQLSNVATVSLEVTPVNDPPRAVSDAFVTDEDTALSGNVLTNDADPDQDPLTAVLVASVQHGTLSLSSSGAFTYSPAPDFFGTDAFTYRANDGTDLSVAVTATLTVTPVNDPPLAVSDVFSTEEDTALSGNVLTNDADPDQDPLSTILVADVQHGTLDLMPDGAFTYAPLPDFFGEDAFTYEASDGALTSAATASITVTPVNDPPVITSSPVTEATAGQLYRYPVVAFDVDSPITYSFEGPAFLSIDAAGVLSGTPSSPGTHSVTVRASDGLADASQTFTLTVVGGGGPPVFTSTPVTSAAEDSPYSYTVAATDPDQDPLTFSLTQAPSGMNLAGTSVTWTPGNADVGDHSVSVRVTDPAGHFDTQSFTLTVTNTNDPPVLTGTPLTTTDEDAFYSYAATANDPDVGDTLFFSLSGPAGMAIDPFAGVASWTPAQADVGDHSVTITVTDQAGATDSQTYTLTVTNVNDPPVFISTPITSATEDQAYAYTARATDPDAQDRLTYAVTGPAGMTIDASSGAVSFAPSDDDVGEHSVSITATDLAGASAVQSFTLTVANTNDPPRFTSTPVTTGTEGVRYTYDADATDPDPGNLLTYGLDTGPDGMTVEAATGLVGFTPSSAQVGALSVVLRVSDSAGGIDLQSFTLTVANVNEPPVFVSTPVTSVREDRTYQYRAEAIDPDPQDRLTYALSSAPQGMTMDPGALLTWRPAEPGVFSVSVTATDLSGASAVQSFSVTVIGVNDPPVFTSTPPLVIDQHQLYRYVPTVTDPDAGDVVTLSLENGPFGMALGAELTFTPDETQVGPYEVMLRATDRAGASAVQSFTLTVLEVNDPPRFTSTPITTASENQPYRYDADAIDPDRSDTLGFFLVQGPIGMTVDSASGLTSFVPGVAHAGSHPVTIRVMDSAGAHADQSYTLVVTAAGAPCGSGNTEARCSALAWTYALDRDGVPLGAVAVEEFGPGGGRSSLTDPTTGLATLGGGPAGLYEWSFFSAGSVPVCRQQVLDEQAIAFVSIPRLAPLSDLSGTVSTGESFFSDVNGRVDLTFRAGSVAAPAELSAAVLDASTLPGLLPTGWSPAGAVYYQVSAPIALGPSARFVLPAPLVEPRILLASWDEASCEWIATAEIVLSDPTAPFPEATVTLGAPGGYALLVRDLGATQPPFPAPGTVVPASAAPIPPFDTLFAMGEVVPRVQIASEHPEDVTGIAKVVATSASPLPSGLVLPAQLFEEYVQLGASTDLPATEISVAFHQYPPVAGSPSGAVFSTFRVRPRFLLGITDLTDVHQTIDVLSQVSFGGRPLDGAGGSVFADGVTLTFPAGAFFEPTLVSLTSLDAEGLDGALLGFRIHWSSGALPGGLTIAASFSTLVAPNGHFVLARKNTDRVESGWAPVLRARSDALGQLSVVEPENGLEGITIGGVYALFPLDAPQGLVRGAVVNGSGASVPNVAVTTSRTLWRALTDASGRFATLGVPGPVDLFAEHVDTGDTGSASGTLADATSVLDVAITIGPQAPRIVRVDPADTSTNVPVVAAIEVFFSEPVRRETVTATAVRLTEASTTATEVLGKHSLRPDRRSIAFFPTEPLAFATRYRIDVAPGIEDDGGTPISGTTSFSFTTASGRPPRVGQSRLTSWAPGSLLSPCSPYDPNSVPPDFDPTGRAIGVPGFDPADPTITCVVGSAGVSDPEVPVVIVNDNTGAAATTRSLTNGSFKTFIRGSVEDLLSAVFTNQNGTELSIPLELQKFDDGSVALYASGGVVKGPNPVGPAPVEIVVEPGAIARRMKIALTGRTATETLLAASSTVPEDSRILFGSTVVSEGPRLNAPVDVRFPVDVQNLALPPGVTPEQGSYLLTRIRRERIEDRELVFYEVLDRMQYESGALVTHSYPMLGLVLGAAASAVTMELAVLALAYPSFTASGYTYACSGGDCTLSDFGTQSGSFYLESNKRVLPGTVVFAETSIQSTGIHPGALRPGMFASVSDGTGRYAIVVQRGPVGGYLLRGTHAEFPGIRASTPILVTNAVGTTAHLLFEETVDPNCPGPPDLAASHTPDRPIPGASATIVIEAVAPSPALAPTIEVPTFELFSLGSPVSRSDVTIVLIDSITEGDRTIARYRVTCRTSALVRLGLRATGCERETRLVYPIAFGGDVPPAPHDDPSPEPLDTSGPSVERSIPPEGGRLQQGAAITLFFSEPISSRIRLDTSPIALTPSPEASPSGTPRFHTPVVALDVTQRRLDLTFPELEAGTDYTLTVSSGITDLRPTEEHPLGNPLDQDPLIDGNNNFVLHFRTEPRVERTLVDVGRGGGAVIHGGHAFILDRASNQLVVEDISNPRDPKKVGAQLLDGYPRGLILIPNFAYVRPLPSQSPPTCAEFERLYSGPLPPGITACTPKTDRTLLVVAAGSTNSTKSLKVFDITDAPLLRTVVKSVVSFDPISVISNLVWSPPNLSYLELSSASTVNVINLQKWIFGLHLDKVQAEAMPCSVLHDAFTCPDPVPLTGTPGVAKNDDGDYADPMEELPLPPKPFAGQVGLGFAGLEARLTPAGTNQLIRDYALDSGRSFVGAVLETGQVNDGSGTNVGPVYRTLWLDGQTPDRFAASFSFGSARPVSVAILPHQPIRIRTGTTASLEHAGTREVFDLAVVGTHDEASGEDRIHLLSVGQVTPERVGLVQGIRICGTLLLSCGGIHQIERHPTMPGVLRIFTSKDILLLAIDRLTMAQPPTAEHPSLIARIPGVGSPLDAPGASTFGVHVVSDINQIVFLGPELYFGSFLETALVFPEALQALPDADRQRVMSNLMPERALRPARSRTRGDFASELDPPNAAKHFHVIVHAPGGHGDTLPLYLESTDEFGQPLHNTTGDLPPVRAASTPARALSPSTESAPIASLLARRLSSSPSSKYFNTYLSSPFAVVTDRVARSDLATLSTVNGHPRPIFFGGYEVRASLEPTAAESVLKDFASSEPLNGRIRIGSHAEASAIPGDRALGEKPKSVVGAVRAPGTSGLIMAHNGALMIETVDLAVPGVSFVRSFVGQDLYQGPFGPGFDFNYNQRLVDLSADNVAGGDEIPIVLRGESKDTIAGSGDVLFHDGMGTVVLFHNEGSDIPPQYATDPLIEILGWQGDAHTWYVPEPGVFDALVKFESGQFARLTPDGTQYWYSASGRLQKIYDRYANNRTELYRKSDGRLRRIEDKSFANKRFIDVGYYLPALDPSFVQGLDEAAPVGPKIDQIRRLKDHLGRTVLYDYDPHGRLTTIDGVEIKTPAADGFKGRRRTSYAWRDGIVSIVDGSDAGDALLTLTPGSNSAITEANGYQGKTTIAQDTITTSDGAVTTYTFDAYGLPRTIQGSGPGSPSETTAYRYTKELLLESVTYPLGNGERSTYDSDSVNLRSRSNRLTLTRFGQGRTVTSTAAYNARYNLPSGRQTDFAGDAHEVTLENDARDIAQRSFTGTSLVESMRHDPKTGQLRSRTSVDGVSQTFGYDDPSGFLSSVTSGGVTATIAYGCPNGKGLGLACTRTQSSIRDKFRYDELGQLILRSRSGFEESIARNANGDPIHVERMTDTGTFDRETRVYDQQGFLTDLVQENLETKGTTQALRWKYTQDSMKRIASVEAPSGGNGLTTYAYDHRGRAREVRRGDHTETLGYDLNGNLESRRIGLSILRFDYNGLDQLRKVTDPEGGTFNMTYNGRGDLRTHVASDLNGILSSVAIDPDPVGRPKHISSAGSNTAIHYEPTLHQIRTVGPKNAEHVLAYDSGGRPSSSRVAGLFDTTFHRNDGTGRVTAIDQVEGGINFGRRFSYDARSSLESVRDAQSGTVLRFENRLDGLPKSVSVSPDDLALETDLLRTSAGESLGITRPLGLTTKIDLDEHRRPSRIGLPTGPGRTFGYDSTGRLNRVTDRDGSTTEVLRFDDRHRPEIIALPGAGRIDAHYDLQGRLTSETTSFGTVADTETFSYDALDRVRTTTFPGGSAEHHYSLLGVMTGSDLTLGSKTFSWSMTPDALGAPDLITYPSGLTLDPERSNVGRLERITVVGDAPLVTSMSYATATEIGTMNIGGVVTREDFYDHRRRLLGRRYTANGQVQADLRYRYDGADREIAVQFAHEGGRTNFYRYDDASRLVRADLGARLNDGTTGPWQVDSNGVPGSWSPGDYLRTFRYDSAGEDRLEATDTIAWGTNSAVTAPEVGSTFTDVDTLGFIQNVDGFVRTRDALGNTTTLETETGASTLIFDGRSRLRRVTREDGTLIDYSWKSDGMLHSRRVSCPASAACVPGETTYVYAGMLLLEEWDLAANPTQPKARYFYADEGDIPLGADFWDGTAMRRHYFMVDRQGSVIGVLDANGRLVERSTYDPWGRPRIEPRDNAPPAISEIVGDANGDVLVVFTEPIEVPVPATATTTIHNLPPALLGLIEIEDNGAPTVESVRIDRAHPGYTVGSVVRITPRIDYASNALYTLVLAANAVADDWGNGNAPASVEFRFGSGTLYSGAPPDSTRSAQVQRSTVGNGLGFQSHLHDPEADLMLMRARIFDPRTGSFLSLDPNGEEDSVDRYAGFAHDPINNRDPTGMCTAAAGGDLTCAELTELWERDRTAYRAWLAQQLQPGMSRNELANLAALTIAVELGAGIVDLGRLGEGSAAGGVRGYVSDALRAIGVASIAWGLARTAPPPSSTPKTVSPSAGNLSILEEAPAAGVAGRQLEFESIVAQATPKPAVDPALQEALVAELRIGEVPPKKVVAANIEGDRTLSGWTNVPGFRPSAQLTAEVLEKADEIGFSFRRSGALDQGVPGRYCASHAEPQLSLFSDTFAVSKAPCPSCKSFLSARAVAESKTFVVKGPDKCWRFSPSKTSWE